MVSGKIQVLFGCDGTVPLLHTNDRFKTESRSFSQQKRSLSGMVPSQLNRASVFGQSKWPFNILSAVNRSGGHKKSVGAHPSTMEIPVTSDRPPGEVHICHSLKPQNTPGKDVTACLVIFGRPP